MGKLNATAKKIALIREKLSIIESEIQVCKRILRGEQE